MTPRHGILAAIATTAIALLCAAAATAAPSFRPPAVAGPTASALPSVAFDPAGNAAIAYLDGQEVKVASRPPGGGWGAPQTVGDVGLGDSHAFAGFDGAGNLTVIWATSANETAYAVTRAAGTTTFGSPQQIATGINPGLQMDVDFARSGAILLVWGRGFGSGVRAVRRPAGGQFEPEETIGSGGDSPRGAVGEDGTMALVWHQQGSPAQIAVRPPGSSSWEGPTDLGAPVGPLSQPNVAVDASGNTLAIWIDEQRRINARVRPAGAGAAFGAADQVADLPGDAYGTEFFSPPQLAFDGAGNATLLWSQINNGGDAGSPWRLFSAFRRPGQAFEYPVAVSSEGENAEYGRLAVAPDGTALATWRNGPHGHDYRQQNTGAILAVHGASGAWSTAPLTLSPSDSYQPAMATASSGAGAVAWIRMHDAQCRQLEVSDFAEGAPAALNPPPRSCDPPPPPDLEPPIAALGGKTKQRAHTTRRIDLTIVCDEACSGQAKGTLTLKPRRGKSSKVKLAKAGYLAKAGSKATVRFRLTKAQARRLAGHLAAGGSATLGVTTAARDLAGNEGPPLRRTVRLVR
ncbi:MAG TPA: hypothetical protein VF517_04840 [Thermoleophilaceae bacterium]|jgi:hypothetical protein